MTPLMRRPSLTKSPAPPGPPDSENSEGAQEWLVTNGIGGYASGTIVGRITRRFHGLLVAVLPAPLGRTMMFNHLAEVARLADGTSVRLDAQNGRASENALPRAALLEFVLEHGCPIWRYAIGPDVVLEKSLVMPYGQNTVHVRYRLQRGTHLVLELSPWLNFRPHEGTLDRPLEGSYSFTANEHRYDVSSGDFPPLHFAVDSERSAFFLESAHIRDVTYDVEKSRGYEHIGNLYQPGFFQMRLDDERPAWLMASTEPWDVCGALTTEEAFAFEKARRALLLSSVAPPLREGVAGEMVLAADQFVVTAIGRVANRARSHALGEEITTVIAGYHWFTDWGRDTMISLEGLTLVTHRYADARSILRAFSRYVRDGLIPNNFPEGANAGVYYTADATLWFFHAIDRYVDCTGDTRLLEDLLPILVSIAQHHLQGTSFGIGVDPADGLLRQGSPDHPLTWMDAKMGDLIVTPRRGKAVEINALYYNALCLLARWVGRCESESAARPFHEQSARLRASFNRRFWYEAGGHLYDVVDGEAGDDSAFRPNQILAISLPNAVLEPERWRRVVDAVEARLVTPVGLRSLAPAHPDYKARYFGDLRTRDLAYHQGTVWAWLIGPFVDAWLKVHSTESTEAARFLSGFASHIDEACIGTISEVFDAEPPHAPRGCVAQAWSVAEVLRLYAKLGLSG
jgi:predicted glycogen debranching enzyme